MSENETNLDLFNSDKLTAFQMRFKGHTYKQIAENVKYTEMTLETYFTRGGMWYESYREWAKAKVEDINDHLTHMFIAQAEEAFQGVVNISKGVGINIVRHSDSEDPIQVSVEVKDSTILKAHQDILDRAGFKPKERVEVESVAEDTAEKKMQRLEEIKARKAAMAEELSKVDADEQPK